MSDKRIIIVSVSLIIIFFSCTSWNNFLPETDTSFYVTKDIMGDGVPIGLEDENVEVKLVSAAAKGKINAIKSLLNEGINVNTKNVKGDTALMMAAFNGHRDVVKFLLNNRADVKAKNNDGLTALFYAQRRGHTSIVELLKQHGAKE